MPSLTTSTRITRLAVWVWLGFLLAVLLMDVILYTPQAQRFLRQENPPQLQQPNGPAPQPNNLPPQGLPFGQRLFPIIVYYLANFSLAFAFLLITHWGWVQHALGKFFHPLLILIISTTPIFINVLVTPRFPPGPLANAEGMALRQLPVLFVALALVASEYRTPQIVLFSVGTAMFELALIFANAFQFQSLAVFVFIAIIRTITFIALGILINQLVLQLKQQGESLRQANANLSHYASTLEQLTVSRERNRLARELHDTLAHSLTALSVSLETAKAYFDVDLEKTRTLLDTSLTSTRKGVDETRRALRSLRSSDLEDLGLSLALKKLAESAAARFNLDLELALPTPSPSLSPDVEQTIHRVAQEAIQNITSHANASKLALTLEHNTKTILTIHDNGKGFDPSENPSGHFGLVGMKERASLAGGTLTIESAKGKGTMVRLEI